MAKQYTTLSLLAATASGVGTAVRVGYSESVKAQVSYTSTGGTVEILLDGSVAPTSTGTFVNVDDVTTTGAVSGSYFVTIPMPVVWLRARTLSHSSTGTVVTVNAVAQIEV